MRVFYGNHYNDGCHIKAGFKDWNPICFYMLINGLIYKRRFLIYLSSMVTCLEGNARDHHDIDGKVRVTYIYNFLLSITLFQNWLSMKILISHNSHPQTGIIISVGFNQYIQLLIIAQVYKQRFVSEVHAGIIPSTNN